MHKLIDLLYYGGVSPRHMAEIGKDIDESNRKSVISYSVIALIGFVAIYLYAALGNNTVSRNTVSYLFGIVVMAAFILLNHTVAKKNRAITSVTSYLFVVVLLSIGIMLAAASREDVTASYMVFLFVAPLLFTLRPLYVDLIILLTDAAYVTLMLQIQSPVVFQKNIINAIIYGILSIFVCTTMTRMRLQKFETDYRNRILMETDQLTGMLNRRSYEQHLSRLKAAGSIDKVKVCAFDVNGLKKVNDLIGHHAGDELLCGAAACLSHVFSRYGYCYRVGGDEFIAILQGASPSEAELKAMLNDQTLSFKGTYVPGLSISAGIVEGTAKDNIDDLLRQADVKMYENKAAYYQEQKKLNAHE